MDVLNIVTCFQCAWFVDEQGMDVLNIACPEHRLS